MHVLLSDFKALQIRKRKKEKKACSDFRNDYIISCFVGVFEIDDIHLTMSICPRHRDSFGIRWRCKKKFCAVPPSWAPHRARQLRGDRSITFIQSKLIFKMTSTLVPVGSRKYLNHFCCSELFNP